MGGGGEVWYKKSLKRAFHGDNVQSFFSAAAMCRLSPRLVTDEAAHVLYTTAGLAEALGFRHESSSKAHKS